MSKIPEGDEALWVRTKTLITAGGLENMIEILMDETGWPEKQARKYAGLALKHCAVDYHRSLAVKDRNAGIVIVVAALALLGVIQALSSHLSDIAYIAPPIILAWGVYLLLRHMKRMGTVNKARGKLAPPPHEAKQPFTAPREK